MIIYFNINGHTYWSEYRLNLVMQILLLNLVISCENVGVFALATNGLSLSIAKKVHRIGIVLSLLFKLLFIAIASVLFAMPWLHIRIVGGVILLYITFNMLLHSKEISDSKIPFKNNEKDNFLEAIFSILVAVISMSLDDAIAISSIISEDGGALNYQKLAVALIGLFFGAFILLLFSDTMTKLIEQFPILNYLCAGYLAYMAIKMIFEDDTIKLFFERVNFTFAVPGAALCGLLMAFYGLFLSGILPGGDAQKKSTHLPIYCIIVIYSLVTVGTISYLDTNPMMDGYQRNVQSMFGFNPSGANAIYVNALLAEMITICTAILAGTTARDSGKKPYISLLFSNIRGMLTYVLLGLFVNTIGLSFIFGFGAINLITYLSIFLTQILLLLTYAAAFTMISTFLTGKTMIIVFGLLFIMLEPIEAAVFITMQRFPAVAYFFPSYHLSAIAGHITSPYSIPMTMLISILYIALFTYIGYCNYQSDYGPSKTMRK